jgi:Kef-type K+ transport system membrane component KefB/Trk K+ transport system NAD-binding subunit
VRGSLCRYSRPGWLAWVGVGLALVPGLLWATEGGAGQPTHGLVASIGASIIVASVLGYVANLLRQPLLLAYIAAGVVIGPKMGLGLVASESDIQVIAEVGLILLLFMIGLEIDIKKLLESGKPLVVTGVSQFLLSVALGLGFFSLLGYSVGGGSYDLAYLAVCCAISSTTIVVKLLYEKFELDTLAGRITLGVLVFQDVWAIVFLGLQPNLAQPAVHEILWSFGKGALLIAASLLLAKYALGRVFEKVAKLPELVLVASLGWVFLICAGASYLGLSLEMGALIAGVAISTFPYNLDVIAKIVSIRDFFVTLFFVGLGMLIPNPLEDLGILAVAGVAALFLIVSRFLVVFPILYFLKSGLRVSLLVPINLAQISEFALVIAAIGINMGHIGPEVLSVVIFVFAVTSITSTYMIAYSHPLQRMMSSVLKRVGVKDIPEVAAESIPGAPKDIAILGFYRVASALIAELRAQGGQMLDRLLVVDFNPVVRRELQALGVKSVYGDISHMETLQHAGIADAKVVLCTIPDSILKGTHNLRLIRQVRKLAPHAKLLVTAETTKAALGMYHEGADYVLVPGTVAARQLVPVITRLLAADQARLKQAESEELSRRQEILD